MGIEEQLLLQLIQVRPAPAKNKSILKLAGQVSDWPLFIQLCQRHGLLAIVGRRLSQFSSASFPDSFRKNVQVLCFHNAARSMSFTRALIHILDLFSSNSIQVIPFKGPLLAQQLYGDVGQRVFGDLDLFVGKQNVHQAIKLLRNIGFMAEINDVLEKIDTFSHQEDNLALIRKEDGCQVELHWDISGCYLAHPLPLTGFKSTATVSLAGRSVNSLAAEDLLVYLCIHGAKHIWERLEWIYSVGVLLEKYPHLDWKVAWERARDWQCQRMLLLGLQLSHEMLGTCLPEEVRQAISRDESIPTLVSRVRQVLFPGQEVSAISKMASRFSSFHLLVRDSPSDRIRYGIRLLLRPTVKEWQTWPLPSYLTFLYYFYRPLRLAWEWRKEKSSDQKSKG